MDLEENTFPFTAKGAMPKASRGQRVLDREEQQAAFRKQAVEVMKAVRARDGGCRWPEAHKCRGGLEACHVEAKGIGGDHGARTTTQNELLLCAWIHRRGPASLHGFQLKIECETPDGCDGPLSFWREDGGVDRVTGKRTYVCIARERSVGVIERD